MKTPAVSFLFFLACTSVILVQPACRHATPGPDPLAALYSNTQVIGDIVYKTAGSHSLKLDAYIPVTRLGEPPWVEYSPDLKPVLFFLHGGGWTSGNKISRSLFLMPFLSKGFCVVTADYRLLSQASLPEIISDTRAALRWIYDHSRQYKFDTARIVVSGESAGGHLALMNGVLNESSRFPPDSNEAGHELKVAAVVNWFGVADLVKASSDWDSVYLSQVAGPDPAKTTTVLRSCSPVNYVDAHTVPILTIHGSEDRAANYDQALLLHDILGKKGIKNQLLTIPGKKHGNFNSREMDQAMQEIWNFLSSIQILN